MLSVAGLWVEYGKIPAVRDVSLHVDEGEIVALVGPNGAGKTTVISTLCGLVSPRSGSVSYRDKSIVGIGPERIFSLGVSTVPEGRHIFETLTVRENLLVPMARRRPRRTAEEDVQAGIERFPVLARFLDAPASHLSGGQRQQLAIARALVSRPDLLLLDEPTLGLDPLTIDTVFRIIEELRDDGVTVLLVEQNATRAVQLADRSYVMSNGEIVLDGDRADLVGTADFATMYLGGGSAQPPSAGGVPR